MDELKDDINNVEKVEEKSTEDDALPITFDELLKDPEYQREFDKKVAKALEKSKAKWQKDEDAKKTEAENLARMSEKEKFEYQIKKLQDERNAFESRLNAYELKGAAQKIAQEKGMDIELLDIIDFSKESAESVKDKLEMIHKAVNKATEKLLNDRLKQSAPKNVEPTNNEKRKVDRASY